MAVVGPIQFVAFATLFCFGAANKGVDTEPAAASIFSATAAVHCIIDEQSTLSMEFEVQNLWNGSESSEDPVRFQIHKSNEGIKIDIEAPFFNDPPPPNGKPGEPYFQLWDYEVAEIFFLASSEENEQRYLELEFGPHGQHLGLILTYDRNTITHSFPIKYQAKIDTEKNTWSGEAFVPLEYFPPNVDKFNAYSIHGPAEARIYKALFPVPGPHPDFHRLEHFQELPCKDLVHQSNLSTFWSEAIKRDEQ